MIFEVPRPQLSVGGAKCQKLPKAFETYNSKTTLYLHAKSLEHLEAHCHCHHPQVSDTVVQTDLIPICIQSQVWMQTHLEVSYLHVIQPSWTKGLLPACETLKSM